jgi:hypothetical protein
MATGKKTATTNPLVQWLQYLQQVIEGRMQHYFSATAGNLDLLKIKMPSLKATDALTAFIAQQKLPAEDVILLLVSLAPHIDPVFFDRIVEKYLPSTGDFPQFGGVRGKNHRGFLPTGETGMFLLAGGNMEQRLARLKHFQDSPLFNKLNVLWLEDVPAGEPLLSGRLVLGSEYVELFINGTVAPPKVSIDFPAQYIHTELEWSDVVLSAVTQRQIEELQIWVQHHTVMMNDWDMRKKLKPGYRALFHGPPGTGKTLAASLLGKYTGRDVFRIDLSMIISKYIGETEKNLSRLFDKAEYKNWILFFDEADALFGKRTNVRDAHDKYANQEVSYLLQRVEAFDGLVILASNFKTNIDEAFIRRFQSVIHFPMPNPQERAIIWEKSIPTHLTLAGDVQLNHIARKYELTGASIMNVVQHCCLQALHAKNTAINEEVLLSGIKREFLKEGKVWQER